MILYYLLFFTAYIILSMLIARLGRYRKWGYWGYLWSSILFTPLLGFLFILASDPAPRNRAGELMERRR